MSDTRKCVFTPCLYLVMLKSLKLLKSCMLMNWVITHTPCVSLRWGIVIKKTGVVVNGWGFQHSSLTSGDGRGTGRLMPMANDLIVRELTIYVEITRGHESWASYSVCWDGLIMTIPGLTKCFPWILWFALANWLNLGKEVLELPVYCFRITYLMCEEKPWGYRSVWYCENTTTEVYSSIPYRWALTRVRRFSSFLVWLNFSVMNGF